MIAAFFSAANAHVKLQEIRHRMKQELVNHFRDDNIFTSELIWRSVPRFILSCFTSVQMTLRTTYVGLGVKDLLAKGGLCFLKQICTFKYFQKRENIQSLDSAASRVHFPPKRL